MRIGAGVFLALLLVTCTDKNVTGPARYGSAALDLRAFEGGPQPGMPDIPLDSVRVILRRLPSLDSAAGEVFHLQSDTLAADSFRVDVSVSLKADPESFQITVFAYGGNTIWYVASDTTSISSGGQSPARMTARYVGPGAGATSVTLAPQDTTVTGGQAVTLRVTVDSGATVLANVPVGILSGDTTKGKVTQPTYTGGVFTGKSGIRDSVWLYVETPTHLRDSTRIHIVPPPSQIVKISGDSQTVIVNGSTAAPLAVRVEDALNGGSPGVTVTWTVTQGAATFSPPSPITSDTGGYARVTVTPSSLGAVKVQASATGLTGSPITFTVNVLAGIVHQVIVAPKLDTLAKGATVQFTATLKDSLGNVISSVKPVWTSSNTAVATVDSTGLATALAADSTYIIAAAGGYADTARLFVRAPVKVLLSPSDTVITSIGDSVHLTGVVLTNFGDTVKTATVIRFASAVPSVVTVNAVTGEAVLVGAGNGVVQATDTVNKVTGTATLRVNQKVFGVVNAPPDSIEVGVGGQAQILAVAKDKNGHPIPGKSFGWLTRNPSVATVNQSGVVTGVAIGAGPTYAVDTLVDSVTVFRDSTLVSVVPSPPPVMRWAFDTLAIGNGGNTTVNVSLNVPSAAGTVMQIISADTTKVKPTQTRIVIGTGGANASVTLQGLAATLAPVDVVAQDSAGIYKPDTLRVIVVSTIFFAQVNQTTRTQDFYLNQNETLNGQVFLSDAAPAGGLGVTFTFAKGLSSISPTTVIIPGGQLAASVQFFGTGTGTDSVTPSSGAFAGKFSYLHVARDTFTLPQPYPYTGVIGLGQTEQPYAQITNSMDHPLPFNIGVSPPIATVSPNPDTIVTNGTSRTFTITGIAVGSATITVSSTHWHAASIPLIVSAPQLISGGNVSLVAGNPTLGSWTVYAGDTLRYNHNIVAPLTVHAVSRDTTIVKLVVDSVVIPAGSSYNSLYNSLFGQPAAGGDSTWVLLTAPGYKPDSMLVRVTKPTMTAAYSSPYTGRVGVGAIFPQPIYVQIPYARSDTFALVLKHTNRASVAAADTLFIIKGQTIGYLASITGTTLGVDSVSIDTLATKPGYVMPAGTVWVLYADSLHVRAYPGNVSLVTISQPTTLYAQAYGAVDQYPHNLVAPLRITLTASRPNVVTIDSVGVTIPAGSYQSNYDTIRVAAGVNAPDSTRITSTAPGSSADSNPIIRVTATPLTLGINYSGQLGRGLRTGSSNTVNLPAAAPNSLTVVLSHAVPGKDSVIPVSVTIPKGSTFSNSFDLLGVDSVGTDTLIASATGFVPARTPIYLYRDTLIISKPGGSQLTTAPPFRLFTNLYNKAGYNQRPWAPVTITVTSSDPTVVAIDSGTVVNGAEDTVTSVVDTAHYGGYVRINFVGPGPAYLKATAPGFGADSFLVNVTGPSLFFTSPSNTTGVGQMTFEQVTVQNTVTGSPVVITLQRSDSTNTGAAKVFNFNPVTLTIPVGSTTSNVDTLFGDTIATAQLFARATGYGQATATIQVGKPQLIAPTNISLLLGAQPTQVNVNTQDQTGNYRQVAAPLSVTATVTDPSVATVDSATRVVPFGGNSLLTYFKFTGLKKGSVQTIFSAPGYKPDTMLVAVDTGTLNLQGTPVLAVGQTYQAYLSVPFTNLNDVVVTLNSTNPSVLSVPATVTIPAGQTAVNFFYTGTGIGTAQVTASAPGLHQSPAAGTIVTAPHVTISITLTNNAGQAEFFSVYTTDSSGVAHGVVAPVVVHLSSSAGTHATFQSDSVVIPAGSSNVNDYVTFDTAGAYTVSGSATSYVTGTTPPITVSGVEVKVGLGNTLTFTPGTDTVHVNSYATWVWDPTNSINHQIRWLTGPGSLPGDSNLQSSGTYQVYFTTPGTYTYWCTVHTVSMQGTIVVQ